MLDEGVDSPLQLCVEEVAESVTHHPTGDGAGASRAVDVGEQRMWEGQSEGGTVRRQVGCMALTFLVVCVAGSRFEVRQEVRKFEEQTRKSGLRGYPYPWM